MLIYVPLPINMFKFGMFSYMKLSIRGKGKHIFFPISFWRISLISTKEEPSWKKKKRKQTTSSMHFSCFFNFLYPVSIKVSLRWTIYEHIFFNRMWAQYFISCNKRRYGDSSTFNTPQRENFCITTIKVLFETKSVKLSQKCRLTMLCRQKLRSKN